MGCLLLHSPAGWYIQYDDPADRTAENLLRHLRFRIRQLLRYRDGLNHTPSGWCDVIAAAARSGGVMQSSYGLRLLADILRGRPLTTWSPDDRLWLSYLHVMTERLDRKALEEEDIPALERILLSVVDDHPSCLSE